MRIHTLTFQAIGPYPNAQTLDFDRLDTIGLFLLDGPTGAGKSTILDVITFALYGKPHDERKNTELQSTLAEPGTPPTITLDVSFGNRRFVIDRTLQHHAPRRGAKTPDDVVTRNTSIVLTEVVAGETKQLSTRIDEAQQILREAIGLSRDQFTSVVLLPQGDFARFLKASSNDREAILRQLFNTHRFDELGDYLAAQAKQLRTAVEADSQRRDRLRNGLVEIAQHYATQPGAPDALFAETELFDLTELDDAELVAHLDSTMNTREAEALRRVEQASTALETARKQLVELQDRQVQLREATDYRQRLQTHRAQAQAAKTARAELDQHARAKPVIEAHHQFVTARDQLATATEQWQHLLDQAQDNQFIGHWATGRDMFDVGDLSELDELVQQWKTVESAAIRELERLEQHEKTQASITAQSTRLDKWKTTEHTLQRQLTQYKADLQTLTKQLEDHHTQADQLSGVEQTLQTATQRLSDAKTQQTAAKKAQRAQTSTQRAEDRRDAAKRTADEALETAQNLMRRRIEAAAGFLAENLQDGQPCEVCGSTSHPDPAAAHGLAEISNNAVKVAEQQATEARREAHEAEHTYQTEHKTLQELQTQAGGLTVADAADAVAQARQAVTIAKADVDALAKLRSTIQEQQTRVEDLRAQQSRAEQQHTEATTQIATLRTELQQSTHDLTQALGRFDTVQALREAVEPAHRLVGNITDQCTDVVTAHTGYTTAAKRVTEALQHSATETYPAFESAEAAIAHTLDTQTQRDHEALLRQWTTEADRLEEKARQPTVRAGLQLLDDDVAAPTDEALEAAQQQQRAAQNRLAEANREHGSIDATRTQAQTQQQQLTEVSQRSAQQRATYDELVGLSDVIAGRGENAATMPLRSFVLAGWLEQVAANASERLTGMTGGRYELKHAVGQGGRGHAGLNLEVIDHLNDTVRTPSTLSGGETFMASLALALGLADAVQAQAGGVAMDTLFIDEGFGSLDAETLDDVMAVLDTLQDDGRLIGLVSHVESMKQQIPHRIQVQKSQTGSSVRLIGPDLG